MKDFRVINSNQIIIKKPQNVVSGAMLFAKLIKILIHNVVAVKIAYLINFLN